MTTQVPSTTLLDAWKPTLMSGVLAVVLGGVVLLWRDISVEVAAIMFGVYLAASGAIQLLIGVTVREKTGGQALLFTSGATSLVLGVLAFRHFSQAVVLLGIGMGMALLIRGVATMVYATSDQDAEGRGLTGLSGLVTAIAGVIVMALPVTSIATLAIIVGLFLLILGVVEIISSYEMRMSADRYRQLNADAAAPAPSRRAAAG
jgi:uncharacterized membrane protein HdeD (DUF308 family)